MNHQKKQSIIVIKKMFEEVFKTKYLQFMTGMLYCINIIIKYIIF